MILHQCEKQTWVFTLAFWNLSIFPFLNATPLIKMDLVAPTIVLCSKLNMTSVCKCNSHSVFVGLPLFILILYPKIEFFICCSVYTLNLMLFPSLSCFFFLERPFGSRGIFFVLHSSVHSFSLLCFSSSTFIHRGRGECANLSVV